MSQRKRKGVEQSFGWMKMVGMLRKVKLRGMDKVRWLFTLYWSRLQPLPIAKPNGPSMTSDSDAGQLIESHAI